MKEILIKGVATPVNFSLRVINNFARKYGMEFQSAMEGGNNMGSALLDHLASLTMEALNEGARRSGLTTRYTEDEVWDMLDDEPALIPRLYELFAESITPLTDRLGDILPAEQ